MLGKKRVGVPRISPHPNPPGPKKGGEEEGALITNGPGRDLAEGDINLCDREEGAREGKLKRAAKEGEFKKLLEVHIKAEKSVSRQVAKEEELKERQSLEPKQPSSAIAPQKSRKTKNKGNLGAYNRGG